MFRYIPRDASESDRTEDLTKTFLQAAKNPPPAVVPTDRKDDNGFKELMAKFGAQELGALTGKLMRLPAKGPKKIVAFAGQERFRPSRMELHVCLASTECPLDVPFGSAVFEKIVFKLKKNAGGRAGNFSWQKETGWNRPGRAASGRMVRPGRARTRGGI